MKHHVFSGYLPPEAPAHLNVVRLSGSGGLEVGLGVEEAPGAQKNSALAIQATAPYPALQPSPATPVISGLF